MASSAWDDLRKQARLLENEIDQKLISFSKLGTGYENRDYGSASLDTVPLLSGASNSHVFDAMALEIEQLLTNLTDLNDKMTSHYQNVSANNPNHTLEHTIQRHREILKDYSLDFKKIRSNIQARRDREELLGSVRKDIDAYKVSSGLNRRTELYSKEHEHIRSSDRLVDEQIRIAMKTKEDLLIQRSTLKAIQTKMTTLANRFPVINSLIQRINLRKRRDSIILGAVLGVCLILILVYAWY